MNNIWVLNVTSESNDHYVFVFRELLDDTDTCSFLRERLHWEIIDDELLCTWYWTYTEIEDD